MLDHVGSEQPRTIHGPDLVGLLVGTFFGPRGLSKRKTTNLKSDRMMFFSGKFGFRKHNIFVVEFFCAYSVFLKKKDFFNMVTNLYG